MTRVKNDIMSSNAELDKLKSDANEMQELITEKENQLHSTVNSRENLEQRILPLEVIFVSLHLIVNF